MHGPGVDSTPVHALALHSWIAAGARCPVKRALQLTLGIVTSVGGFLEIGSVTTSAQAGAGFGYQLIWSVVLGTVCLAFLTEMSGRFAICSKRTIPDAMRERFGANVFLPLLSVLLLVSLLVLGAELGGVAAALNLATGIALPVWALPVAIGAWLVLWRGTFGLIENGTSLLGLVTLVFAVGAIKAHPDYWAVARGVIPTVPKRDAAHYWYIAVSVLGASVSPYLYYFYCSGAIEERWDETYLKANRAIAAFGMGFGGMLAIAILVLAAVLFHPTGRTVNDYHDLTGLLTPVLGRAGFWLFAASLGIGCLGATLEIALSLAYTLAQGLGWRWGEDQPPRNDARFALTYTGLLAVAGLIVLVGIDPLALTEISMVLTAATLPLGVLPFLVLMNDKRYLGDRTNGWLGNTAVLMISVLAAVLAVVSVPLELVGS